MKIAIFGTGYVGLVTGVCLADLGHQVTCVDVDPSKIELLNNGEVPIFEPGLETLLFKNRKRISFTLDPKNSITEAEVIFIAVGTPQAEDGSADLRFVDSVAKTLAEHINDYKVIVIKSTVPIGTGDRVEEIIRSQYDRDFAVVSNPEFLKEGDAVNDFNKPDRIIIGTDDSKAIEKLKLLYKKIKTEVFTTDRKSAELIKYASNAMLATKISFINSIANVAQAYGADIESVAQGIGLDKRIGPHFLKAGLGYGGSCFPKDVAALIHIAKAQNIPLNLLKSVTEVNMTQKELAVKRLSEEIDLKGKTVGVLGLSFKPNTDDLREAASLTVVNQLLEAGVQIKAWDPISEKEFAKIYPTLHYCPSPYEVAKDADAVIVITEWDEVKRLNLKKLKNLMKGNIIFDGRNVLNREDAKELRFNYVGVGR